jgi:hypothetical protein
VLYTSDARVGSGKGDSNVVDKIVGKMYGVSKEDEGFKKLQGTMNFAISQVCC